MFVALGPLHRSKTQRLLLLSESRLVALRQIKAAGSGERSFWGGPSQQSRRSYWRKTGGFALAPQTMLLRQQDSATPSGLSNRSAKYRSGTHARSDPASIHPRLAA